MKLEWDPPAENAVSTFSCEFTFEDLQPWRAASIESKLPVNHATITIVDGKGRTHTFFLQNLQPLKKRRVAAPDYIGAKQLQIEMQVQCSDKCELDMEEFSIFAQLPDITYGTKDAFQEILFHCREALT